MGALRLDLDGEPGGAGRRPTSRESAGNLVPQRDDGDVGMGGVVAEDADRRGAQPETPAGGDWQADPSHREGAAEMAVGEERDIAFRRAKALQQPIGAIGDLFGRLAAGTASN